MSTRNDTTVEATYATARQRLREMFGAPYERAFAQALNDAVDNVFGPAWSRLRDQQPDSENWDGERLVERLSNDLHRGLPFVGSFHEMLARFVDDVLDAGFDGVEERRRGRGDDIEAVLRGEGAE